MSASLGDRVRAVTDAARPFDLPPDPMRVAPDPGGGRGGDPGPGDDDTPPEAVAAGYPLNDTGNAARLVLYHGDDLIYVPRVGWFLWTGQVWKKDDDGLAVRRVAQGIGPRIEAEAAFAAVPVLKKGWREAAEEYAAWRDELAAWQDMPKADLSDAAKKGMAELEVKIERVQKHYGQVMRHAKNAGNSGPIGNMLQEATTRLGCRLDDLDAEPLAVNLQNGTLWFSVVRPEGCSAMSDVALHPHRRADRLTKMMPVGYDPDAKAPLWDAFLRRIQPDPEIRAFLQRWFGLSMTALTEQKLVFQYGHGANGKSVLMDTVARVLGDYAATAKIESLTGTNRRGGGDATPDLVPLIGARSVRASEPEMGTRLQEGVVKELTGGEPILVRALHSDFVEVRPVFKLTISGNHKPDIRGTDDGIWRRMLLVPFEVQIPKDERDPLLGQKLFEERAGILNWMVAGLLDYLEGGLREPEAVLSATEDYRRQSDPLGQFLSDCMLVTGSETDWVLMRTIREAFNWWLVERGEPEWTGRAFGLQMAARAGQWRHPATGMTFTVGKRGENGARGMRMTDTFRAGFDARQQKTWRG